MRIRSRSKDDGENRPEGSADRSPPPTTPPADDEGAGGTSTTAPPETAPRTPFDIAGPGRPQVTVRLNGGREVSGLYQGRETIGQVTFIKLSVARIEEPDREKSTPAEVLLVPVELVELAAVLEEKTDPPEQPSSELLT